MEEHDMDSPVKIDRVLTAAIWVLTFGYLFELYMRYFANPFAG